MFRNLRFIKWKLRFANSLVMEQVTNAYARSILIYMGTPLVAAGIWSKKDVQSIEKAIFKKTAMVPNNINPTII